MSQHSKPYSRFDPAHLFDGLFVPTSGRKRGRLYVPPKQFGDTVISFQGFEELGADDQSVLLAISAQLGVDGLVIKHDVEVGEIAQELQLRIALKDDLKSDLASKKTSLRSIFYDAGYEIESGAAFDAIKRCLNRLANAQIREIDSRGWDRRCNLIAVKFNHQNGDIFIAANPRLTEAIFHGQHVKISLYERNQIKGEVAKILHAWLCSNIRLGSAMPSVKIDTLLPHIYGQERLERASPRQMSSFRQQTKRALKEISNKTDWKITISGAYSAIQRPKNLPPLEEIFPHGKGIVDLEFLD